jgi:hypothetical protein
LGPLKPNSIEVSVAAAAGSAAGEDDGVTNADPFAVGIWLGRILHFALPAALK